MHVAAHTVAGSVACKSTISVSASCSTFSSPPAMPRLPPMKSRAVVRQVLSLVAPSPNVTAHARGKAAAELQKLSQEQQMDDEDKKLPSVDQLQWSSPLEVLQYPHPRLRAPNARLSQPAFGEELSRLAAEMFDIMYRDDGVGLAAPQVGVNVRLMVFNALGVRGDGEELVLANPRVISSSSETDLQEEGCLSFRRLKTSELLHGDVQRSLQLKVRAQDANGRSFVRTFKDWPARVFQHEFDHLQGTLFPDRIKPTARAHMSDDLRLLEDDFLKRHPNQQLQRYK